MVFEFCELFERSQRPLCRYSHEPRCFPGFFLRGMYPDGRTLPWLLTQMVFSVMVIYLVVWCNNMHQHDSKWNPKYLPNSPFENLFKYHFLPTVPLRTTKNDQTNSWSKRWCCRFHGRSAATQSLWLDEFPQCFGAFAVVIVVGTVTVSTLL